MNLDDVQFKMSSFCTMNGCVEIGRLTNGQVAFRDTKDRSRPVLIFTNEEWLAFVAGVRAGEFDEL